MNDTELIILALAAFGVFAFFFAYLLTRDIPQEWPRGHFWRSASVEEMENATGGYATFCHLDGEEKPVRYTFTAQTKGEGAECFGKHWKDLEYLGTGEYSHEEEIGR